MQHRIAKESDNLIEKSFFNFKQLFPNCIAEGKIDFEKLKKTFGNFVDFSDERYSFNWAGKNNAFKTIQATSRGTLAPLVNESVNFDKTENVFIEGDNLEVLKLLQKSYFGKIKVIYIDPPYNTGNDFIYQDDFSNGIGAYLEQTGQVENGIKLTTNPETNGRFHSDWLSMMFPRLYIARNLLRDDGLIFVSIDDNEVHHLRIMMDEIFGEENFIITIVWKKRSGPPNDQVIGAVHEYILCYAKNSEARGLHRRERTEEQRSRYKNPNNHQGVIWDSLTERNFAEKINGIKNVKLFIKLPDWFVVKTPVGEYNPDWSIVMECTDQHGEITDTLYFMTETKGTTQVDNLRPSEKRKIKCAEKHFQSINVGYTVLEKPEDITEMCFQ